MFWVVIRKHVVLTWNCHQQWFKIICCCWWLEWKLLHFKWYLSFIRHILTYCAGPNGIESQCWPAFGWPMILGQRQVYWSWIYFLQWNVATGLSIWSEFNGILWSDNLINANGNMKEWAFLFIGLDLSDLIVDLFRHFPFIHETMFMYIKKLVIYQKNLQLM